VSDDVVQAVRDRFDHRAPSYDGSAMHRDLAAAVAAFVDLDGVADVLDVATGTGLVLRALRERPGGADLRLVGVDVSAGMLAVAREHLPGADLREADARDLPLPDACVDLVTCVTGLHLIPGTPAVVAQWARVLRPAGRVVTATFASYDPAQHHREQPGSQPPYPQRHAEFATVEALDAQVADAGLTVVRHGTWTDGHDVLLLAELARGAR
jgi:ubiquinone/menaquinone biosynthesis C-methylase UbiE